MEKEQRSLISEVRANEDGKHITGYCVRFNEQSEDLGFFEVIERGAITQDVIDKSDVYCLFNHDEDKVLGRSLRNVGNLKLTLDENGVMYDCELLDNELANTVRSYIQAGLVNTSSFAFTVADGEDAQEWRRMPDGTVKRTIKKIDRLYDASPVWSAAYSTTSCSCRAFDEFKAEEKRAQEEADKALEKEYQEYIDKINSME